MAGRRAGTPAPAPNRGRGRTGARAYLGALLERYGGVQAVALAVIVGRAGWLEGPAAAALRAAGVLPGPCGLNGDQQAAAGAGGAWGLYSSQVVLPGGGVGPATVWVRGGRVAAVEEGAVAAGAEPAGVEHLGQAVVGPGLVDVHAHLNEPGREHWEGFLTGTAGAAAGGVTTLVDMPLNTLPATTTLELFERKLEATEDKLHVDVAFWGGLVPENAAEPAKLRGMLDRGVLGLKTFLSPSGSDDFRNTNRTHCESALRVLVEFDRPLMVHAELPHAITDAEYARGSSKDYATYHATRPKSFELDALAMLLEVSDAMTEMQARGSIHVAHLSTGDALAALESAKRRGNRITVETCPHFLLFAAESIPRGNTLYKCAPPIREAANQALLWDGLLKGTIDSIGSDHSPSPGELKLLDEGDFLRAWGGISGLQYLLPATYTALMKSGKDLADPLGLVHRWLSTNPAKIAGLPQKGSLAPGKDADIVVWLPDTRADTRRKAYLHKNKETVYEDMYLVGKVARTYVRGQLVFEDGNRKGTKDSLSKRRCGRPVLASQTEQKRAKLKELEERVNAKLEGG